MDNQNQEVPQVTSNYQWLRTLGIGFGIVSFGIAIGVIGYILGTRNSQKVAENQQSAMVPTAIPTPTLIPDETANWKTYTSTQLPEISLKAYSVKYSIAWSLKIETDNIGFHKLTLSKENHLITIYQASYGGGGCIFEDEVPEGPFADLRNKKYTQIESGVGTLRRFEQISSPSEINPNIVTFSFCVYVRDNLYKAPTAVGQIDYKVPKTYDELILTEMDNIIKTLEKAK